MPDPRTANSSQAANPAESLLLEHPAIAGATVIDEDGADGRIYPVAYVVLRADCAQTTDTGVVAAGSRKRVGQWKKTFDHAYRTRDDDHAPSFSGWTSSFTGALLPESEMQEWLKCTVDRIRAFEPESVLEIGCGVGLLLRELAPRCKRYRAIDLSPIAVARLRAFVSSETNLQHIELQECEATDLQGHDDRSYDTVVINSVIQYFPDVSYLSRVIAEAARVVKPGGRIFIGDVRHHALLPLFHGAVQRARAPSGASVRWLKRKIRLAIEQDRELSVDPEFFLALSRSDARIGFVDILLKRGRARNEMTQYRYDAVLHVGEADLVKPPVEMIWRADDAPLAECLARCPAGQPAVIRGVPNLRLARDVALARRIWSADDDRPVETVAMPSTDETEAGWDPETVWSMADTGEHDISVRWAPRSDDGRFDVVINASGYAWRASSSQQDAQPGSRQPHRLATDPLEAASRQRLGVELQHYLHDQLPVSSLPAAVIVVDGLPDKGAMTPAERVRQPIP